MYLQEEISGLRERITSKAGIDETNEAFRAEIDSLTAENSYLKQQARERDREASDQRDKIEELSSKVEQMEKEKQLYISNVGSVLRKNAPPIHMIFIFSNSNSRTPSES